jgi:ribosomal protein L7/L12
VSGDVDITYLLVALGIVALPFVLTRLLSGGSGDTDKVLGAEPRSKRTVPQARTTPAHAPASAPAHAAAGAARGQPVAGLHAQVMQLISQRRQAEAIRLVHERTGVSPDAARAMVAKLEKLPPAGAGGLQSVSSALRLSRELSPKVVELLKTGQKIEAIKLIRAHAGVDLKTAKDIVDRLAP